MDRRPTCSCGHDRYHHHIRAELTQGTVGWLALFNGLSATPKRIVFSCARCGETFETTTDPVVLKQYRRYPYVTQPDDG